MRLGIGGNPFQAWHEVQETGVIPEEALRLGVEFSDGAKATAFDGYRFFATKERPTGPVLCAVEKCTTGWVLRRQGVPRDDAVG